MVFLYCNMCMRVIPSQVPNGPEAQKKSIGATEKTVTPMRQSALSMKCLISQKSFSRFSTRKCPKRDGLQGDRKGHTTVPRQKSRHAPLHLYP